jgi:hypothetical protein
MTPRLQFVLLDFQPLAARMSCCSRKRSIGPTADSPGNWWATSWRGMLSRQTLRGWRQAEPAQQGPQFCPVKGAG